MSGGLLQLLCATLFFLHASGSPGWDDCLKHLTEPEQCTCLQWFTLSTTKAVDKEDVKQGFRLFAKHAHPDKHPDDPEFWTKVFRFGKSCKDFLTHADNLQLYQDRIANLQLMARKKSWTAEKICERIEEFHDEISISSDGSRSEPLKPRFEKREGPAEKVHLFLDDSVSMSGLKLSEGKEAVRDIMPRLERSPSTVHLIGPRDYSRQIFGLTDDFVFDDISEKWQAPERPVSCDVLFMMDITGSMQDSIDAAGAKVVDIAHGLVGRFSTLRFGFLGYRDLEDSEQFSVLGFTSDPMRVKDHLNRVVADGGGDGPEDVLGALEKARGFAWSAQQRILIHVADAPGHEPRGSQRPASAILQSLVDLGIEYTMLLVGPHARDMASSYSRMYAENGSPWPMRTMEFQVCRPDTFQATVMDAAFEATPFASGTFLWQYVYEIIRGGHGHDEEVAIVTDGYDNGSDGEFRGTDGFNHMMRLLKDAWA